jgi:hypothetical protein
VNRKLLIGLVGVGGVIVCAICGIAIMMTGGGDTGEPQPVAQEQVAPTATVEVVADTAGEEAATNTPIPPPPTFTPTVEPTATPVPTPTPEPIVLEGAGDSVVSVEKWGGPAIAYIRGNQAGGHFAVTSLDINNEVLDLLVNTVDPYEGARPIDFEGEQTTRFEVQASGDWRIEIRPVSMGHALVVPGSAEGSGDEVLVLLALEVTPDTAIIQGNEAGSHFAVIGYGDQGWPDLLVNTVDPYAGTVAVEGGTTVLAIQAVGGWSVEVTAR